MREGEGGGRGGGGKRERECVCVCVRARARVCVREKEIEREGREGGQTDTHPDTDRDSLRENWTELVKLNARGLRRDIAISSGGGPDGKAVQSDFSLVGPQTPRLWV